MGRPVTSATTASTTSLQPSATSGASALGDTLTPSLPTTSLPTLNGGSGGTTSQPYGGLRYSSGSFGQTDETKVDINLRLGSEEQLRQNGTLSIDASRVDRPDTDDTTTSVSVGVQIPLGGRGRTAVNPGLIPELPIINANYSNDDSGQSQTMMAVLQEVNPGTALSTSNINTNVLGTGNQVSNNLSNTNGKYAYSLDAVTPSAERSFSTNIEDYEPASSTYGAYSGLPSLQNRFTIHLLDLKNDGDNKPDAAYLTERVTESNIRLR
jgi:hypothetical protein